MANKIQLRRDTAANWTRNNPILADGELGLDITNNKVKAGDGTTAWAGLSFLSSDEHTRLVNGSHALTLGTTGILTLPGTISSSSGVTLVTGRGNLQLGVNLEAPGVPTHFHINKAGADAGNMDLFLGDDTDYVKLPSGGGVVITAGSDSSWAFSEGGNLVLPASGIITTTPGYEGTTFDITAATQANPVVITTQGDHGLNALTNIAISGITTMTQLNGREFYVTTPTSNTLELYEDPNCTISVDGTQYTDYTNHGNRTLHETNSGGSGPVSFVTALPADNPTGQGTSISLDNASIVVPGNADLSIGANQDFTIEAYMKYSSADIPGTYAPMFGATYPTAGLSILNGLGAYGIFQGSNGNAGSWIGGLFQPSVTHDVWYHIAFVRDAGKIRLYVDGSKVTPSNNGGVDVDNDTTAFQNAGDCIIGHSVGYGCHGTLISNFRLVIGTAVYTSNFSKPTSPLTAIPNTAILVLGNNNFNDTSGSQLSPGGGSAITEFAGADLRIELDSPGLADPGSVKIRSGGTTLKVNGRDGHVAVVDSTSDEYPINSSGQQTIELSEVSENVTFNNLNTNVNLIYITQAEGYDAIGDNGQSIELPYPARPGIELNIINDNQCNVSIILGDGPTYPLSAWENIKLVSYTWPGGDGARYWWVTGAFTWNF